MGAFSSVFQIEHDRLQVKARAAREAAHHRHLAEVKLREENAKAAKAKAASSQSSSQPEPNDQVP